MSGVGVRAFSHDHRCSTACHRSSSSLARRHRNFNAATTLSHRHIDDCVKLVNNNTETDDSVGSSTNSGKRHLHDAFRTRSFPVCANVQSTLRAGFDGAPFIGRMSPRPRSICGRLRMLPALPTGFRLCVPAFLSPYCDSSHPLAPHRPRLCCCEADLWVLMVIPRPNPQARRQAPNESPWQDLVGGSRREAPLMINHSSLRQRRMTSLRQT